MITIGNKEFRNIQEQVEKNKNDILYILEEEGVLNEFGLTVVGQEASTADLPATDSEEFEALDYGATYAIGITEPYRLYIKTRANGTHPNDYWFDLGYFPLPGPQGETGPAGFSPEVSISPIDGGTRVSITDAEGTNTFDVMEGSNGTDGADGKSTLYYNNNLSTIIGEYTNIILPSAKVGDLVVSLNGILGQVTSISDGVIVQTQTSLVGPRGLSGNSMYALHEEQLAPIGSSTVISSGDIDYDRDPQVNDLVVDTFGLLYGIVTAVAPHSGESTGEEDYFDITILTLGSLRGATGPQGPEGTGIYRANAYVVQGQSGDNPQDTTYILKDNIIVPTGYSLKVNDLILGSNLVVGYISALTGKNENPNYCTVVALYKIRGNYIWKLYDNTRLNTTIGGETSINYDTAWPGREIDPALGDLVFDKFGYLGYVRTYTSGAAGSYIAVITYANLNGPAGQNGTNGTDGVDGVTPSITAAATVSNTTGTPSVTVTKTGTDANPTFTFAFSNIKGEPGTTTIGIQVVNSLPASGTEGIIYLVPSSSASGDDNYDEYIYINNDWELIGHTAVDLTNYIQKSSTSGLVKNDGTIDTNVYALASALNDYVTTTSLGTTLNDYVLASALATVATSGSYTDLTDTPDLSIYAESSDLATVATTGDYDDLDNKPDLSVYAESSDLATVATTGDYDDLINKPTIPTVSYPVTDVQVNDTSVLNGTVAKITMPTLAAVATSGSYNDLINKPTIPSDVVVIEVSDQTTTGTLSTAELTQMTTDPTKTMFKRGTVYYSLAVIGSTYYRYSMTSGFTNAIISYFIIINKNNGAWEYDYKQQNIISSYVSDVQVDGSSVVSNGVASITMPTYTQVQANWNELDSTAASYIQNKPTIPAAQVNSDWNSISGVSQILNKPTIPTDFTTITLSDTSGNLTNAQRDLILEHPEKVIFIYDNELYWNYFANESTGTYLYTNSSYTVSNDTIGLSKVIIGINTSTNTKTYRVYKNLTYIPTTNKLPVDISIIEVSGASGTLSADDLAKITAHPEKVIILRSNSYYTLSSYDNTIYKYCTARNTTSAIQAFTVSITASSGAWSYSYQTSVTSANVTTAIENAINYKNGDKFTNSYYFTLPGYITSGSKQLQFALTTPKLLGNITSVTVNKFEMIVRGVAGYVNGSSYIDYEATTGYTVTATVTEDNVVELVVVATTAYTGATNNTPVSVVFPAGGLDLTFNIASS